MAGSSAQSEIPRDMKAEFYLLDFTPDNQVPYPHLYINITRPDGAVRVFTYKWRKIDEAARRTEIKIQTIGNDEIGSGKMMTIDSTPFSSGGFGDVFRAKTNSGFDVVVKKPKCPNRDLLAEATSAIYFEAAITSALRHPNIIDLITIIPQPINPPWLVYWYYKNGSLAKFLPREEDEEPLCDKLKLSLTTDIAEGMNYLHENYCIHRDLNLRNILVDNDNRAIIADFGLATFLDGDPSVYATFPEDAGQIGENFRRVAYTLYYCAPEVLPVYTRNFNLDPFESARRRGLVIKKFLKDNDFSEYEKAQLLEAKAIMESPDMGAPARVETPVPEGCYGFKSDVWSFGVVTHQIWTGAIHDPYSNTANEDEMSIEGLRELIRSYKQNSVKSNPCSFVPLNEKYKEVTGLLMKIFQVKTSKRPYFNEILKSVKDFKV